MQNEQTIYYVDLTREKQTYVHICQLEAQLFSFLTRGYFLNITDGFIL